MTTNIGFLGILGIIFVVLKLTAVITWSWWLVLLPFYLGVLFFVGVFLIAFLIAVFLD